MFVLLLCVLHIPCNVLLVLYNNNSMTIYLGLEDGHSYNLINSAREAYYTVTGAVGTNNHAN